MTPDAQGRLDPSVLAVGMHAPGASPKGLEDVLLTPGELLSADASSLFNACTAAGTHCVVAGLSPGSIDTVEPFYSRSGGPGESKDPEYMIAHAYGFRCVIDSNEVSQ
jgi:hypothetical protein